MGQIRPGARVVLTSDQREIILSEGESQRSSCTIEQEGKPFSVYKTVLNKAADELNEKSLFLTENGLSTSPHSSGDLSWGKLRGVNRNG